MIRDEIEAALKHLVKDTNHLTLAEYRDRLADKTGVQVHPWTVGRALRRLGLTRKKKTLRAIEQDEAAVQEERRFWPEAIAGIAVERFVFLDESAARTDLVRTHAWSRLWRARPRHGTVRSLGTRHHPGGAWAGGDRRRHEHPTGVPRRS
jgi:hypothetical protein